MQPPEEETLERLRSDLRAVIYPLTNDEVSWSKNSLSEALTIALQFRELYPPEDDPVEGTGIEGTLWKELEPEIMKVERATNRFLKVIDKAGMYPLLAIGDPAKARREVQAFSEKISAAKERLKARGQTMHRTEWLIHSISVWAAIWLRETGEYPAGRSHGPFTAAVSVLLSYAGVPQDAEYLIRKALQSNSE